MTYVDTSVLLPAYVPERDSEIAGQILVAADSVVVSDLGVAEFSVALARKVRCGELTAAQGAMARAALLEDIELGAILRVPVRSDAFDRAGDLAATTGVMLRTLDAIHLAVARELGLNVATFDLRLADAARTLGIGVITS